jgi:mRNA-degrading endonuclease YafQ of YafQ-DinJ toxin-antitoxin module
VSQVARYHFTRHFNKQFAKLSPRRQAQVRQTLRLAMVDLDDPRLRLHELKGPFAGTYSISAGGDLRIHCGLITDEQAIVASLQAVGTHSQLYG